jgi:UDP-glucose 4-epimerase
VGGRLVETLLAREWEVRGLNRDPARYLPVEEIVADLSDPAATDAVEAACEGIDTIVHLAGENEVLAAREPAAALAVTVVATERLVEAAARAGVTRLVYVSTVHVYGRRMVEGATLTEDMRPEPRSSYAISRLASEHVAAMLASEGSDLVVLRLTNSVGAPPHPSVDRWTLVANDLCRQGALGGRLELRTSGMQWRDFVAMADVCDFIAAASLAEEPVVPSGTYNLGSGTPTTVRGLAGLVQDAFERVTGERPDLKAPAPGDAPEPYLVSVARAREHGLQAWTPLEKAVEETARFCLTNREEIR